MRTTLRSAAIAASTFAFASMCSLGWSGQDGVSLTVSSADARSRVYITTPGYYGTTGGYYTAAGLPWYAVRAYYFGGSWSGPGWSYTGWSDYAARNGIGCTPGTAIKGGDGIMYACQ